MGLILVSYRLLLSAIFDIDLQDDLVNLLICQLFVILLGTLFRMYRNAHRVSPKTIHVFEIFIGSMLAYFRFGRQIIHVFVQSILCFVLMKSLRPGLMEKVVLVTAMAYLCVSHAYRLIYVTGPMMLNTQKLSSLAFGIKDAYDLKNGKKMSDNLRSKVVRKFPSILEFASYVLSFHGVLCGPFFFYTDYIAFIEGKNYASDEKQVNENDNVYDNDKEKIRAMNPSPYKALFSRLSWTTIFGLSTILVAPHYSFELIAEPNFQNHSFLYKMYLIMMVTFIQRQEFYFIWKLGEAGMISAGMGYNTKSKEWDLIDSANIWNVEFSTSFKVVVNKWNICTTNWLRYVVYERIRNIFLVFLFSALWHGFNPGYYIFFCTLALFLFTSRLVRGNIRPWFQSSKIRSYAYDILTLTITRVAVAYATPPFYVLKIRPTIFIYKNVFFFLHIGAAMLSFTIIVLRSVLATSKTS